MITTASGGVLDEIRQRLTALAGTARDSGMVIRAPLLILGTCERVGSNWLSDALRPVAVQHNEPFRQQLSPGHPLSALNPFLTGTGDMNCLAGGLTRHWLVSFAVAKYGPERQVLKETNLYFALPALLALLPGAPVVVLSRSPVGVASSFTRGDLFRRWGYQARYQQMLTMTRDGASRMRRLAALVPDDNPPDLVALTRLQVLNTMLIADAVRGRPVAHVSYETAVTCPGKARAELIRAVPDLDGLALDRGQAPDAPRSRSDSTFATTNHKTALLAGLEPEQAVIVRATTAASLAAAEDVLPAPVAIRAASWLAGGHHYGLEHPRARPRTTRPANPAPTPQMAVRYVRADGLEVRNLLVSNAEYARFLNTLSHAGMPNTHHGTYLLACEMPHERGGRLHQDPRTGTWTVSPGYDDHPAYWVTWIGAAAFAASTGARLPARAELTELTRAAPAGGNAGYRLGDVTPVTEPGAGDGVIHHLLGNLQNWCCDGPGQQADSPAVRWLHGIAWNTPATRQAAQQSRGKHILGSSRGVGIRLVRDGRQSLVSISDLAATLGGWIDGLADRSAPLAVIDQRLIRALDASQADGGFRPHVAAGTGEPGHG
jgi:Sulfatase-modifying factor enzyme 1